MIECPVKSCKIFFLNKYSLTNHLRKSSDREHKNYYESNILVKPCISCKTPLRNNRKFKNDEGLCYTCYKKKYFKKPEVKKRWLKKKCFKCKKEVVGYFSPRNTRVLCGLCSDLKEKRKKEYNREFDKKRYKEIGERRCKGRALNKKKQLEDLTLLLKEELLKDTPIHLICKKYHISLLSIRKILPLIMTEDEYNERNHKIRSKSVQLRIEFLKNFLKNNPNARNLKKSPNLLEKKLGDEIKEKYSYINLRYNVWKSLRDEVNECYIHLESDLVLNFNDLRIIILVDGEAFHGLSSYFNGNTIEEDERRSRILFRNNPFVIRYSETEIKEGFALNHLSVLISDITSYKISKYYRNWMTEKEITQ